jgi:hypothetical protein
MFGASSDERRADRTKPLPETRSIAPVRRSITGSCHGGS